MAKSHHIKLLVTISFSLCLASMANTAQSTPESLSQLLEKVLQDTTLSQTAVEDGRQRALICSYCHGKDGNSIKPEVPNLAGQNPLYLLAQIEKFATAERKDFVMNSLARQFSAEDKVNLAIYYARQTVKPVAFNPSAVARGKALYHNACSHCHGERGIGKAEFARLAGQQTVYVINTLKRFRSNALSPETRTSRRSEIMESFSKDLTDSQIESLAAYIAQLR